MGICTNTNPSSPYCIMRFIFGPRVHPSRQLLGLDYLAGYARLDATHNRTHSTRTRLGRRRRRADKQTTSKPVTAYGTQSVPQLPRCSRIVPGLPTAQSECLRVDLGQGRAERTATSFKFAVCGGPLSLSGM